MKIIKITHIEDMDITAVEVDFGYTTTRLGIPFLIETEEEAISYIEQNYPTTKEAVEEIDASYVIHEPVELTPAEKLANAGLSVDELKLLLGIK